MIQRTRGRVAHVFRRGGHDFSARVAHVFRHGQHDSPDGHRLPRLPAQVWVHIRPAFSLVEIMMATIILGFGLLMIGAVLPIAWKGSIDAAAHTRSAGAVQAAHYAVMEHCRVDGMRDLFSGPPTPGTPHDPLRPADGIPDSVANPNPAGRDLTSYSFLGDYDTIDTNPYDSTDPTPRPVVHALHLANWAVDPNSPFVPPRNSANDLSVPEAPGFIDRNQGPGGQPPRVGIPADLSTQSSTFDPLGIGSPFGVVGAPVVGLGDRLFPPIPSTLTPEDFQWQEVLDSRAFAWAVFYRLVRIPKSPTDPRYFQMYYVTLRRGSAALRFARQSPLNGVVGDGTTPPTALPPDSDVAFPIAWRVPLLVVESNGMPALAFAGAGDSDLNILGVSALSGASPVFPVDNAKCKVADMFRRGAMFVDENNGIVYQVADREFIPNNLGQLDRLARLTLDKEVTIFDLEGQDATPAVVDGAGLPAGAPDPHNRIVWVFPPAVAARAQNESTVTFTGPNPVIEISVEPLTLMP